MTIVTRIHAASEIQRVPPIAQSVIDAAMPVNECWLWPGALDKGGYGTVIFHRPDGTSNRVGAHRFMYVLLRGEIADGLVIDHLCRNRACVNPDHLEPVEHIENVRRGEALKRRTHCDRGHALTDDNVLSWHLRVKGTRVCKTCHRSKEDLRYWDGKRSAAADEALDCESLDGYSGARCQKIRGHQGSHGGMDRTGTWRHWS